MADSLANSLHDVPLTLTGPRRVDIDALDEGQLGTVSKTNSLRRFFKLPANMKKGGEDESDATEMQERKKVKAKEQLDDSSGVSLEKKQNRRFHLRLGSSKYEGEEPAGQGPLAISAHKLTTDASGSTETAETAPHSSATVAPQKSSLKASISTYWNSMFKRQRATKAKKRANKNDPDVRDDTSSGSDADESQQDVAELHERAIREIDEAIDREEEANETVASDAIQTLAISDENAEEQPEKPQPTE